MILPNDTTKHKQNLLLTLSSSVFLHILEESVRVYNLTQGRLWKLAAHVFSTGNEAWQILYGVAYSFYPPTPVSDNNKIVSITFASGYCVVCPGGKGTKERKFPWNNGKLVKLIVVTHYCILSLFFHRAKGYSLYSFSNALY